jgi:hypothetical protein
MTVSNLNNLVLRGVCVVHNGGTNLKRNGSGTAQAPAYPSCVFDPSTSYRLADMHEPERQGPDDRDARASGRAGRSGSVLEGLFASASLAITAQGSVLSGQSLIAAQATDAALTAGESWQVRGRPWSVAATSAPPDMGQPHAMRKLGVARTPPAQFGPLAGTFTASLRGERKR